MKIISPFRDYYDRIAHQYGGGDPKTVYVRPVYLPRTEVETPPGCPFVDDFHRAATIRKHWSDPTVEEYHILCVAGRGWLMEYNPKAIPVGRDEYNRPQYESTCRIVEPPEEAWGWRRTRVGKRERMVRDGSRQVFSAGTAPFVQGLPHPWIVEVSRRASLYRGNFKPMPVFVIRRINEAHSQCVQFVERTPVLSSLGLPAFLSAEQCYQEIAYFVGNVLRESPDMKPPVEIGNRDKIVAAGFDLKQSFRHRVAGR